MEITKDQGLIFRAIAIIMVMLYHYQYDLFGVTFLIDRGQGILGWLNSSFTYIAENPTSIFGFLAYLCFIGVNVFFVLSGYSLAKKYLHAKSIGIKSTFHQIWKILIPFWLAHPIIHLIDWFIRKIQYWTGVIDHEIYFSGMHSLTDYFQSMLVIPRWFSEQGNLLFVGTWWFVGVIIQFYLLFPIIFRLFKKIKPAHALIICISTSLIYRYLVGINTIASPIGINQAHILLFTIFPARLSEFALGIYFAFQPNSLKIIFKTPLAILFILLGFICLSYIHTMFLSDFLFALGMIILINNHKHHIGQSEKFFKRIGSKSYLIYLYHEPTMKLILEIFYTK